MEIMRPIKLFCFEGKATLISPAVRLELFKYNSSITFRTEVLSIRYIRVLNVLYKYSDGVNYPRTIDINRTIVFRRTIACTLLGITRTLGTLNVLGIASIVG